MTQSKSSSKQHDAAASASQPANPKTAPLPKGADQPATNRDKDPADWVTGDEPMTGAQASYLKTLSEQAKEPYDGSLSKGDASRRIDTLKKRVGV